MKCSATSLLQLLDARPPRSFDLSDIPVRMSHVLPEGVFVLEGQRPMPAAWHHDAGPEGQ